MTRDDTPAGAADPHRRPGPDADPVLGLDPDDADAPSLEAARDAWRALREPLAPGPDLDARIRAAARRAPAAPQHAGGSTPSGGPAAARAPAQSRGPVRRYAGWGLALAATLVAGIVLVLPPAPLAEVPLEAPPAAPMSGADAGWVLEQPPAPALPPPEVPRLQAPMPAAPLPEARPAARPDAMADGTAEAWVEPARNAPVTSAVPVAAAPPAAAQAVMPPGAQTRAEVEATFAAPAPAVQAPSPSPPSSASSASSAREAPSPVPSQVLGRAADAAPATRDDPVAIERELAELRALLRAGDPALPARLRTFVARHPGHPLARTDPALAAVLARDPARP